MGSAAVDEGQAVPGGSPAFPLDVKGLRPAVAAHCH